MILLNMAKCLITIKHESDSYMLLPAGDAVTVPDEAFTGAVQGLIDDGEIQVIEAPKPKRKQRAKAEENAEAKANVEA